MTNQSSSHAVQYAKSDGSLYRYADVFAADDTKPPVVVSKSAYLNLTDEQFDAMVDSLAKSGMLVGVSGVDDGP